MVRRAISVLRARHDMDMAPIPDSVFAAVVTKGPLSLAKYWQDTTEGQLDLDLRVYDWVEVDMPTRSDATEVNQVAKAVAAVRATNPNKDPVTDHDGVFVYTYPGSWLEPDPDNPGSMIRRSAPAKLVGIKDNGVAALWGSSSDLTPASPMPIDGANMTFMAHEFGHVLGLGHSFGRPANNASGVNQFEYGSPYDLMSAFVFGGSSWMQASPTFSLPPIDGWPASYTEWLGPHVARAMLHAWEPTLLHGRLHQFSLGQAIPSGKVRLRATGVQSAADDRTLLVLDPPGDAAASVGRTYVELRVPTGWDRGLELHAGHEAVAGLAVHSVGFDGRVWYRGNIRLRSTDDDLVLPNGGLVVRLDGYSLDDPAGAWADVAWTTTPPQPLAWIVDSTTSTVVGGTPTEMRTTPCGDVMQWGTWQTATTCRFELRTAGYGGQGGPGVVPPAVTWTVDGQNLAGSSGALTTATSAMAALVHWTVEEGSADLTITSPPGVEVSIAVAAEVTDGASTATAKAQFEAIGTFEGYDPQQQPAVLDCLMQIIRRLPYGWPVLRRPDPTSLREAERWRWKAHRWLDVVARRGADHRVISAARRLVDLQTPRRVTRQI